MTEPHGTSAGAAGGREAMSDERLAEIRQIAADSRAVVARHLTAALRELLAEVLRLRANAEADWRGITTALDGWNEEAGNAWRAYAEQRQRAETAERELAEMRERIGEATVKWAVHWLTGAGRDHYEPCIDEQEALEAIPDLADGYTVVSRVVGEWKAVDGG